MLGKVADIGSVDWHAQPARWRPEWGHCDSSALPGKLKVPLEGTCFSMVSGHIPFQAKENIPGN